MKKSFIVATLLIYSAFIANAQLLPPDMLRLAQQYPWGTARAMGMGGAFGSLGGDLTSLSINPAGIGVYRSSEFAITPSVNYNNSKSTFGEASSDFSSKFNLSNIGFVRSFNSGSEEGWVSLNFGIAYNQLNDFNRNITIRRNNAPSSLLDEFNYYANSETTLNPFYEGLAFETGAINQFSNSSGYYSDYSDPTSKLVHGEYQEKLIQTTGGIGEWALSLGANYSNRLYIGFTLGIQQVNYQEISPLYEQTPGDVPNLSSFTFTEHLKTDGAGVNFKAGAIYKPFDMLRLGVAVHSPTFYDLHSEFYTSMNVDYKNYAYSNKATDILSFDNSLSTPWKGIFSAALVLKQYGLISVDYELLDYRSMQLNGDMVYNQNDTLSSIYKMGSNLRIGAEGKIGPLALRVGYGYYGSPFASGQLNQNTTYQSYSAGFGFRSEHFFMDFAYMLLKYPEHYTLYSYNEVYSGSTISSAYNPASNTAKIENNLNRYVMTVGFKF